MKAVGRLAGLFVAPPQAPRRPALHVVRDPDEDTADEAYGAGGGASVATVTAVGGGASSAPVPGPSVCVLGGDPAAVGALATAIAARLARRPGARYALLCSAGTSDVLGVPTPPGTRDLPATRGLLGTRGLPGTPTARRVVGHLCDTGLLATARGRVVRVAFDDGPLPAALRTLLLGGAPCVTVHHGPRRGDAARPVSGHDLIVVVVADGAPAGLGALAAAELGAGAPGAVVQVVALPARGGAGARRAAAAGALAVLR